MEIEQEPKEESATVKPQEEPPEAVPPQAAEAVPAAENTYLEKRQSVRHNVRWRALVLIGGAKVPVSVVDISDGGLSFVANRSLATNVKVDIAIFVPETRQQDSHVVSTTGLQILYQVLRRHEFKFGAKFSAPSTEFLDRIHAAVQRGLS